MVTCEQGPMSAKDSSSARASTLKCPVFIGALAKRTCTGPMDVLGPSLTRFKIRMVLA